MLPHHQVWIATQFKYLETSQPGQLSPNDTKVYQQKLTYHWQYCQIIAGEIEALERRHANKPRHGPEVVGVEHEAHETRACVTERWQGVDLIAGQVQVF